jgi:pilus assembly protein CpaE
MSEQLRVLIASRSQAAIDGIREALSGAAVTVDSTLIINGDLDPLRRVSVNPDVLILRVSDGSVDELEAQARRTAADRCPLVVVSGSADPGIMRLAMQAGARDFITEPLAGGEVCAAMQRIAAETVGQLVPGSSGSVAFVNANGGAGATFMAVNVAHLFRAASRFDTVLLDLDLQFGPTPHYLDLQPKRDLMAALSVAHELDEMALDGYLTRHESGLHVLAAGKGGRLPSRDALAEPFSRLMDLLQAGHRRLVLDVPGQLDVLAILALERVDKVALVMQQSLPSLRNAARMLDMLRGELHLPQDRMVAVVNRYRKGGHVDLDDIDRALAGVERVLIPNHYAAVSESIEMGIPMYEHARSSPVTKALRELESSLGGRSQEVRKGLLSKTFSTWIRS